MLDGRHSGTGGGNHVVIGAAYSGRQPFSAAARSAAQPGGLLAKPSIDVVPVFGTVHRPYEPASKGGRGAQDSLYELGIAFSQVPEKAREPVAPLDGRPHLPQPADRPDGEHASHGALHPNSIHRMRRLSRLGLVELRAFEMPPHARMSLTQQLLVRALIAHFWETPLGSKGARKRWAWGTSLHDRFMLPYFVERDFEDVLEELNDAGYPFRKEWFAPHFEFRFPADRVDHEARDPPGAARRAGALERAGRRDLGRRHGAQRGFLSGAIAGPGIGLDRIAIHRVVQRAPGASASDRRTGRICGRGALSRVAAALVSAPY